MDFLKELLGEDLFAQVSAKLEGTDVKLANLATGEYVSKGKHEAALREVEQERDGYKKQAADIADQLEAAKTSSKTIEDLNAKIKEIQSENEKKVSEIEKAKAQSKLNYEMRLAVIAAGAKDEKSVLAHIDTEKVSLSDKGELVGLTDQLETIKTNHEYLFGEPKPVFKTTPPNPPSGQKTPQTEWAAKLKEAKEKGDNVAAIRIKQEAFEDGVVLN